MGPNPAVDGHRLDQAEPIEPGVEGIVAFVRARLRWVNIDAVRKPKAIVVLKGLLAKHHAGSMRNHGELPIGWPILSLNVAKAGCMGLNITSVVYCSSQLFTYSANEGRTRMR